MPRLLSKSSWFSPWAIALTSELPIAAAAAAQAQSTKPHVVFILVDNPKRSSGSRRHRLPDESVRSHPSVAI